MRLGVRTVPQFNLSLGDLHGAAIVSLVQLSVPGAILANITAV